MKVTAILVCIMLFGSLCFGQNKSAISIQNTSSVELVSKLKELKRQKELFIQKKAALRVKYTEEYYEVQQVNLKITELEKQIASVSNEIKNSGASEAVDLLVSITSLKKRLQLCGYVIPEENCGKDEIKRKLTKAYQQAVQNPEVLNLLFTDATEMFERTGIKPINASQTPQTIEEQNAELLRLIVAQNQKIIQLLEKLADKK